MVNCLVDRNYLVNFNDTYSITTKLFELAHSNPPTNRLLIEAAPIMQELSSHLKQACHLTVYNQGRQVVIAEVDNPDGMGFSVRVGAELDVLVPHQEEFWLHSRIQKRSSCASRNRCGAVPSIPPSNQADSQRGAGMWLKSIDSVQIKGLHAVAYPILDTGGRAIAALTVPYAERLDERHRVTVPKVEAALGKAARTLAERIGWREDPSRASLTNIRDASAGASRRVGRMAGR